MSARSRVVLPAPFRPMITTRSAAPTRSETPFSTGTCPYRAWRPSTSSTRPLPQVDVADDVVRSDLVHGPFGKHGASVEHGDVSRDVSHEVHVVLDHDQRRPPVDLAYEVGRASRLGMSHAGGGLVEERSEEHTSELQSLAYLVCRLLLEKKKKTITILPGCVSSVR